MQCKSNFLTRLCCSVLFCQKNSLVTMETLKFDNLALRSLPIDPETENFVRQVPGACFSRVKPIPVKSPSLVAVSLPALNLIDVRQEDVEKEDFVEYFSGNKLLPGSDPAAHCYCGHQFGYFSGQLGDGAAMYLGEILNKKGERWEIQFKGSGKTPYSRHADGRKVLRSTIREFLCSEAIHHLGIPSTRAGTCVTSDSTVIRDIFYDGHPIEERCTIVLRIAPTFLRFGSFEIFKPIDRETGRKGPSVGWNDLLFQMLDYTIKTFYNEIWTSYENDKETMYIEFFKEVVRRTAQLVAKWQCVGWCHGVLNTDNMSIVGVTIDYGPYGFMDRYDPDFICNASDDGGRYTYQRQPEMCKWNCKKLAEAIQGAVPLSKTEPELDLFDEVFSREYTAGMRRKLGLLQKEKPEDGQLVESFLETMHETGADFTNCFRCLSQIPLPGADNFDSVVAEVMEYILSQCATVEEMKLACKPRMDPRQFQMILMLMQAQPEVLSSLGRSLVTVKQEIERMERKKELEEKTDEGQKIENRKLWSAWFRKYKARLQEEVKATSDVENADARRKEAMNSSNPRFILRNYIAQNAITAAERGDYSEVRRVLKLLENPFSEDIGFTGIDHIQREASNVDTTDSAKGEEEGAKASVESSEKDTNSCQRSHVQLLYDGRPPEWSVDLRVT